MSTPHFPSANTLVLAAGLAVLMSEVTLLHAISADLLLWGRVLGFLFLVRLWHCRTEFCCSSGA